MRPPARRSGARDTLLWSAVAVVAAAVLATLVYALYSPGGGAAPPGTVRNTTPCAAAPCTPQSGVLGAVSAPPPQITARAAAVVEASCGALLYGKAEHERLPPASITKIMTGLIATEEGDLDRVVEVHVNSGLLVASTASSVMGLVPGQRMSVRDLLHGMLLPSGNDAAIAVAEAVAGTEPRFVELMNVRARELEMNDTHFANPHGLDDPRLYSSAYDMAMLGRAALEEEDLAAIVRTQRYQPSWDGPEVWNGNELFGLYAGVIGVKTGYTEDAGQTFVAAAERDGRRIVVSLLGAWDRYSDAIGLLDWSFESTEPVC
jgi:D-alanyl-D-alanine carboxypeptidase (penicillin-binding protein 5/6)